MICGNISFLRSAEICKDPAEVLSLSLRPRKIPTLVHGPHGRQLCLDSLSCLAVGVAIPVSSAGNVSSSYDDSMIIYRIDIIVTAIIDIIDIIDTIDITACPKRDLTGCP